MTTLSLILPCLILVAWWLERRERTASHAEQLAAAERERVRQQQDDKRERADHARTTTTERADLLDRFATERTELLAGFAAEREQWATERAVLLNRIKPETAQPILYSEVIAPPAVPMDDDEAFHESREELAERLGRLETGVTP